MVKLSGLSYVGVSDGAAGTVVNRHALTTALSTAVPNQTTVTSNAIDAAALRASKLYVDNADATYVLPAYYTNQDALNIPVSSRGVANGVASLDSSTKIPVGQIPPSGEPYLLGPYGPQHINGSTAVYTVATGTTPQKIADFEIPVTAVAVFRPWVFMNVWVQGTDEALPVIEVRISDGAAPYASQTQVAIGYGRTSFDSRQAVVVWPGSGGTSESGLSTPPHYDHPYLTAWLYDPQGNGVAVNSGDIASAACFLVRTTQ